MPTSSRIRTIALTAAAGALLGTALLPAAAGAQTPRSIVVLGGQETISDQWLEFGHRSYQDPSGPDRVIVTVREKAFGSTAIDPRATDACIYLQRAQHTTSRKGVTSTTYVTDSGCGSLEVVGLGTGHATINGTLPSKVSGEIEVGLDVGTFAPSVRGPAVQFCHVIFPCYVEGYSMGLKRTGSARGVVTSDTAGSFALVSPFDPAQQTTHDVRVPARARAWDVILGHE